MAALRSRPPGVRLDRTGQGRVNIQSDPSELGDKHELEGLLALIAAGDQQAFAGFYDLISHRVFGLVARVLRDRVMSEEVTQEIFFEIWRKAPRFDPTRGSALSWTMTIAHRRAVDRVRAEERHSKGRALVPDPDFDVVAETVEAGLDQRYVRKALETLSPIQQEVVVLAYYSGYTYRQVAEHLNIPLGTMKTRMRDGLLRLRAALDGIR